MPENKKAQGSRLGRHYISNKVITEVKASASWNILFLAVLSIILLSGGIALIVIFGTEENKVQDLILIGAILLATSLLFIVMFIVSVTKMVIRYRFTNRQVKPCSEQDLTRIDKNKQAASTDKKNKTRSDAIVYVADGGRGLHIPPDDVELQRRPSAASLYGMADTQPQRDHVTSPPYVALPIDSGVMETTLTTTIVHSEGEASNLGDNPHDDIKAKSPGIHNSLTNSQDGILNIDHHDQFTDRHDDATELLDEATDLLVLATDETDRDSDDASQLLESLYEDKTNNNATDKTNFKNLHGINDSVTQVKSNVEIFINERGVDGDDVVDDDVVDDDSVASTQRGDEENAPTAAVLNNRKSELQNGYSAISRDSNDVLSELGSRILHNSNSDLSGIKDNSVGSSDFNKDLHSDSVEHTGGKDVLNNLYSDVVTNDDGETRKDHQVKDGSVNDDSVINVDVENGGAVIASYSKYQSSEMKTKTLHPSTEDDLPRNEP